MTPTKEELDMIPSIWDGWTNQCYGKLSDGLGGVCISGWLYFKHSIALQGGYAPRGHEHLIGRVAAYIRANCPLTPHVPGPGFATDRNYYDFNRDGDVLIYANNELKLTPDQFRHIDKLTQWQAMQKQIDGLENEAPRSEQTEIQIEMKGGTMNEFITDEQIAEIEELEEKIAPESSAGFLD